MKLQYEISAVGLDQLKRVVRGVEHELVASSRRMAAATGTRGGRGPGAANSNASKAEANAIRREAEKATRDAIRRAEKEAKERAKAEAWARAQRVREIERERRARERATQFAIQEANREARERAKAAERAARDAAKAADRAARDAAKAAEREAREKARAATKAEKERIRAEKRATKEAEREAKKRQRADEQAARAAQRARESMARGVARSVGGATKTVVGLGAGVLGIGGGFMVRDAIQASIQSQAAAIDIVNAASVNRKGRTAADVDTLTGKMAVEAGVAQSDVLAAVNAFQAPTGDLDAALDNMRELIKLSQASGTALADMAAAAGRVMAADENIDPENLMLLMRTIAGQGKKGAVEISELATAMAKLTGTAGIVGGNKELAIAEMGAIAQVAIASGGATSGAEAANAVTRFMGAAGSKERDLRRMGIQVRDASGQMRGPRELIESVIDKARGRADRALQFDIVGNRAIQGFYSTYLSTEGTHEQKMAAVRKQFDELLGPGVVMSGAQVDQAAEARRQSAHNKIVRATEEFQQAVGSQLLPAVTDLIPEITKLVPVMVDLAKHGAKFAAWLAENPFTGMGAMIAGLVAKDIATAKIGDAVVEGISRLLGGGGKGSGAVVAPAGGGKLQPALALGGAFIAGFTVGKLIVEEMVAPADRGSTSAKDFVEWTAFNAENTIKALRAGRITPEQAEAQLGALDREIASAKANSGGVFNFLDAWIGNKPLAQYYRERYIAGSAEGFQMDAGTSLRSVRDRLSSEIEASRAGGDASASGQANSALQSLASAANQATNALANMRAPDPSRTGTPILRR